ncbi:MAG: hypothetical protein CL712_03740 [Chloroflexi bacterium]|nr:hypothetical protein [Chloroflexota bacterium]|tara:strand:+ start:221 stop:754 length:534 start_codon:yes stop_codon:yes gene_type:complete
MHRISNEKGLTLLELLVVLAVIGIVATFTIPNISKFATGRTAEKDLATIRSLIDYAKTASYSKGKTMVLLQTNQSTIQVFELSSNDPTKCLGNVNVDNEYSKAISFKSIIKSKHYNNANVASSFNQSNSRMCFKKDATSSGGGFEVKYQDDIFRIEVWTTGFYDITRKIKGSFKEYN